jgi:hypothetical protein
MFFFVGFEVLTAVVMKISVSWDITPYSPVKLTDISEENIASIFRVEESAKQETIALLHAGLLLGLFLNPKNGDRIFLRNVG